MGPMTDLSERIFSREPDTFRQRRIQRHRALLAEKRAAAFAQHLARTTRRVFLPHQRDLAKAGNNSFTLQTTHQDAFEEKLGQIRMNGLRRIYDYLDYEPFDPRVGFMRPVYAVPRQSSTTAPREPS